jgi:hypothetical protein
MSDVQFLAFDQAAIPMFSKKGDTTIGPVYRWDNTRFDTVLQDKPADSTLVYGHAGLGLQFATIGRFGQKHHGALKFFRILFSQHVFKPTQ